MSREREETLTLYHISEVFSGNSLASIFRLSQMKTVKFHHVVMDSPQGPIPWHSGSRWLLWCPLYLSHCSSCSDLFLEPIDQAPTTTYTRPECASSVCHSGLGLTVTISQRTVLSTSLAQCISWFCFFIVLVTICRQLTIDLENSRRQRHALVPAHPKSVQQKMAGRQLRVQLSSTKGHVIDAQQING